MEKANFYKKIKDLKLISHRLGFEMTNYPENSLEVLKDIFSKTELLNVCDGFEFDICFTKDHVPVITHDKYIDDISDNKGLIRNYNLKELKKMNFNFRKSLALGKKANFKIVTLNEILDFFSFNKRLLKDKVIKIETKDISIFNNYNMKTLADIIKNYKSLSKNIVHLSFFPSNLIVLKKIQKSNNYYITKNDLLCNYKFSVNIAKLFKIIDSISLRIKTTDFPKVKKENSLRVNIKIICDRLFIKFSNVINNKTLEYSIKRYGMVGIYVLNDNVDIKSFCKNISDEVFEKYYSRIYFTTDNPLYLKSEEIVKENK